MFKRLIWWSTGAIMGAGGSFWAKRKVKRTVENKLANVRETLQPANIADAAKTRVTDAITAGRYAAHDRERELRDQLEAARTSSSA